MWKEFKKFAMKGSVVDLAVGVVIGGACCSEIALEATRCPHCTSIIEETI